MLGEGGPIIHDLRPKTTAGFLPTVEYLRKHDMRMEGDPVEPFQTFESAGLPPDIMDEVSCLHDSVGLCPSEQRLRF